MTRARNGRVLQGYFRSERARGPGKAAATMLPQRPSPPPPRPELLPPGMQRATAQARPELAPAGVWRFAPRPELLPGMGASRVGGLRVAQPRSSNAVTTMPVPPGQLRVTGEGRPLEPELRQTMERFFQEDFSAVRVHVGPAAPAMGALAFTLGEEIHFAPGLYDPSSREGRELLGHELTHVVQQREGRVANPYASGVAIVQDPELEAEADAMGRRVAEATLQAMWMYPLGALGLGAAVYGGYRLGQWMGWWGGSSSGWSGADRCIKTIFRKISNATTWCSTIEKLDGDPTSCAATMQVIGMWITSEYGRNVTFVNVPQPEAMGETKVVELLTRLLSRPCLLAFQISPNHHFIAISRSEDSIVLIQGYQDAYTVVEWLQATNNGQMSKQAFIRQIGEYATKSKKRALAAALALFSFDNKSQRVVYGEYITPSSIAIKLIQYAYLDNI